MDVDAAHAVALGVVPVAVAAQAAAVAAAVVVVAAVAVAAAVAAAAASEKAEYLEMESFAVAGKANTADIVFVALDAVFDVSAARVGLGFPAAREMQQLLTVPHPEGGDEVVAVPSPLASSVLALSPETC